MHRTSYRPTIICKRSKEWSNTLNEGRASNTGYRSVAALLAAVGLFVTTLLGAGAPAAAAPNASDTPPATKGNGQGTDPKTDVPDVTNDLAVTLGPMETLLGPTWKLDTPFNTTGRTPNVIGYVSNTSAWAYSTSDLFNLTPLPGTALVEGTPGSFDGCGAWLNSTYQDGAVLRGWYHAEANANCANNPAFKSVGYAESYDGGLTFVKPSYPSNRVISAPARFTDPEQASEGDFHVVRVGNYLYLYFVAPRDSYKIHLARSLVSDGGKPGTWWKYYNGSFSQPGLGGESSSIASGTVLGRAWVSYNAAVGEYMGFSWSPTGFGISLSPDGINWRRVTGDIISTNHEFHNRSLNSGELIEYMSLIALNGDPAVSGVDGWLYFMRVPAGQPMVGDTRYLARKAFHIQMPDGCPLADFSDVPAGSTFYSYVRCLACRNVIGGYGDNTFRPNNNITRGQIAKSVSNAAGFAEDPGAQIFEDVPPTDTFYSWVNRLARRGIMSGYPCGGNAEPCRSGNRPYFRPGANATRGQITKLVASAAGFGEPVGSQLFEDVPASSPFYDTVQRMATRGIMAGYPCGGPGESCGAGNRPYFRPGSNATRGQVSKTVSKAFFPQCNP